MKDRLSRFIRLEKAFCSLASAVEIELASRQSERHLSNVRLKEMGEALLAPEVVGLPMHSRMLYRVADLQSDMAKTDQEIVSLRQRLLTIRSRQKFCGRQVQHLSYVLIRKREEDEALEVTTAMMASASGKSAVFR